MSGGELAVTVACIFLFCRESVSAILSLTSKTTPDHRLKASAKKWKKKLLFLPLGYQAFENQCGFFLLLLLYTAVRLLGCALLTLTGLLNAW